MPLRTLSLLTALLLAVFAPGLARASEADRAPVQVVDGYTVAIALASDRAETGPNDVVAEGHGDDHAADGHGRAAIPTMLERGAEAGRYVGTLHLDQPGTATVTMSFTIAGIERATLFAVPVAQSRPRALVLGGFALVNGLAIAAAAVFKRRMPQNSAKPPPRAHPSR